MLNWSLHGYKLTLGVGTLGLTGILSEMWVPALPFWIVISVVGPPLLIFVFADPEYGFNDKQGAHRKKRGVLVLHKVATSV